MLEYPEYLPFGLRGGFLDVPACVMNDEIDLLVHSGRSGRRSTKVDAKSMRQTETYARVDGLHKAEIINREEIKVTKSCDGNGECCTRSNLIGFCSRYVGESFADLQNLDGSTARAALRLRL